MHLSASIGTGEAPMNATALRIALARQRHNVLPQLIEAGDALGQTAPFKNADLDLGYIERTAMFGRVMHLESLPEGCAYLARSFEQRGCGQRLRRNASSRFHTGRRAVAGSCGTGQWHLGQPGTMRPGRAASAGSRIPGMFAVSRKSIPASMWRPAPFSFSGSF